MRVNEKIERIKENTLICGIDIGKKMCCARFCDFRGLEVYHRVWFDRTENLDAIGCQVTAAMYTANKTDVIIAFEPTGHYWLNIDKYFKDCGQETVLMPTYTVKQAKEQYDQNPTKSDPKDALLIARLTSEGKYVKPIERDETYQDIYSGYRIYDDKQKEINRIKNKIHVWNDKYFPELEHVYKINSVGVKPIYENQLIPAEIKDMELDAFIEIMTKENGYSKKGNIIKLKELCERSNAINPDKFTKYEIKNLYERYEELVKELEEIKKELIELASQIDYVEKLVEISGVNYISIVGVIAETGDLKKYEHAKQVLKMSGLSLKENSSGQKKGKKHISKRGRSKLRRNLKQIGISLVKNNDFFLQLHNYYTIERTNPLTKLISINAVIRKFTYVMMAIVKTEESFDKTKAIKESCIFN
jgi:transposase